jgi:hypothetical protein
MKIIIGVSSVFFYSSLFFFKILQDLKNYLFSKILFFQANIISIHVPLLPETHHMINRENIDKMKKDVIIVNTSRGEMFFDI